MVAIVSGISPGLGLSSREVLGTAGSIGNAPQGRSGEGVYVNVATGLLVLQERDDLLVARGEDAAVLRTYNSAGQFNDDNGDNWASGVVSLQLAGVPHAAGSTVTRIDRDGSSAVYSFDASRNLYVTTEGAGAYDIISYVTADAQWEWRDGTTGATQRFEGAGAHRLLRSRDATGNSLAFAYGANGFLSSVTTDVGEATFYDYAGNNLSQVRSVTGAVTTSRVRYGYDASNRLTLVTVDLSPTDGSVADSNWYWTRYTYEGASKRIASIAQADGSSLAFTYFDAGGGNFKLATVRDALNQLTRFTYGPGFTTVADAQELVTRYDVDAAGRLTKITAPSAAGVTPPSQEFTYNANGDVIVAIDGQGRKVTFGYDAKGNQVLQRDDAGGTVTRIFDARNQLLAETAYAVADPDGNGPALPGTPMTTRYVYDAADRMQLRFVVSAEGRVTEHRYNGFGERVTTVSYAGGLYPVSTLAADTALTESAVATWAAAQQPAATQRVDFTYDWRGQLQSRTTYASVGATGAGIADGSESVQQYVYDQTGLLLNTVSAWHGITSYTYDGLGRVLSAIDPLGVVTLTQYADAAGKTTMTLANGLVRTSAYDHAGRLFSVSESDAGGTLLGWTKYFYDASDRLRMTQDATGASTWIFHDAAGRKAAEVDGNGALTEYRYDASDRLIYSVQWGTRVDTSSLVDATGQPVATATPDMLRPSGSTDDHETWREYDAAGRLLRVADSSGSGATASVTENRYDAASRLVAVVRYATLAPANGVAGSVAPGSVPAPVRSADDRVTRNFHDADGALAGTLDAEGYLSVFNYNPSGQLAETVRYAGATDPALRAFGTLAQLTPRWSGSELLATNLYDGKGQLIGAVDAEGYLTEYVYDANGNQTLSKRYATRVTVTVDATSTVDAIRPPPNAQDATTARAYDALNRLTAETSPAGVRTEYRYDAVGNLVGTVQAASTAEARTLLVRYDLQGRVVAELSQEGAALLTGGQTQAQIDAIWAQYAMRHTYDAAGRRTSTTDAAGNWKLFFHNAAGALTHVVNALGGVQETVYDARGRRVQQISYANRISTTGLAGGLVTPALSTALAAAANAALDSTLGFAYTRDDLVASSTDALGNVSTFSYNAFQEEVASTQALGDGRIVAQRYGVDHRGLRTTSVADAGGIDAVTSTVYDAFGRVVRTVDPDGRVREQVFDRLGRVVTRGDALGAQTSTAYDAIGRVLTQTDALGRVTSYAYDATDRSIVVTTPEGIQTRTTYTRHGQVQSVTDGNQQTTTYIYDLAGKLVRTTTPLATATAAVYDASGRQIEATDANGVKVAYTYDAANRVLTRRVDPTGLNLTTTYGYDAKGQQVAETDANGSVTTREFDRGGRVLVETVDPTGLALQTVYTYDARGKVLTVTSPGGSVTQYVHDALGRRVEERVDPTGLNLTRRWVHDAAGNVTSCTDALGNVTRYAYDAENRLVFTLDPLGNLRQNAYDAAGRVTRTVAYAIPIPTTGLGGAPAVAAIQPLIVSQPAQDRVENRVYDRDGRLAATVDGTGAVTKYTYDGNGKVVARTAYANAIAIGSWVPGTVPAPSADPVRDATVRTMYDALNRAIYTMDGTGAVVARSYDANGNLLRTTAYATAISTSTAFTQAAIGGALALVADSSRDAVVRNAHDAANRLTWSADGTGAVTQRVYDRNGNVVRQVAYGIAISAAAAPSSVPTSASDRATSFAYDNADRLVFTVDALHGVTKQVHDADGNVVQRVEYATPIASIPALGASGTAAAVAALVVPNAAADRTTRYGYDAAGRQCLTLDAVGAATETQYDAAGNAVAVVGYAKPVDTALLPAAPTLATIRGLLDPTGGGRSTRSAYDAAGRLVYTVDPEGAVTARQYDGRGLVTCTTSYAKPVSLAGTASVAVIAAALRADATIDRTDRFSYNAAGLLVATTDALGKTESYGYDALGRKLSMTNKNGAVWHYAYDAAGRMLTESTPPVLLTKVDVDATSGNLVVGATAREPIVTSMAYDALGNLTQRTEAVGRPEQRTTSYGYDALGHQVRVTYPLVGVYDAADALTTNGANGLASRVETQDKKLETQTFYDTFGNAVASIDVGGGLSQKAYDLGGRVVYEVDAMGYVTGYVRNAYGEVTALTRYAVPTGLANIKVTAAWQAADKAWVESAINAAGVDHARDRTLLTSYDRARRVLETSEPTVFVYDSSADAGQQLTEAGKKTRNVYDAFGQLVQVRNLRNPVTDTWTTTNHYFDAAGRETATIDALGYLTLRTLDAFGNVVEVTEYANALQGYSLAGFGAPSGSGDDRTTAFTYDALNRKTAESRLRVEYSDASDGTVTRGDVTTKYEYDALGNQTRVTDANGNETFTYYDALGRVKAVAAPIRSSTPLAEAVVPLTEFRRDAHDNVVLKIEYANTAAGASLASDPTAVFDAARDHLTLTRYDAFGHAIQGADAAGANDFTSYDAYGHIAKHWQGVTGNDGLMRTVFQVNVYDKLGQLIATRAPASTSVYSPPTGITIVPQWSAGLVTTSLEYNAFGELTRKGTQGGRQEYFDYDNAGRLWRTNSGDGIDRISLYDALGNATAEIRSSGSGGDDYDLKSYRGAQEAAANPNTRRVDMIHDALGRVTSRTEAARQEVPSGLVPQELQGGVTALTQFTSFSVAAADLRLNWTSLAPLGSGDIKVYVEYTTARLAVDGEVYVIPPDDPTLQSFMSGVFDADEAAAGVTLNMAAALNMHLFSPYPLEIREVKRIVVYKKALDGNWRTIFDQAPGSGADAIALRAPPNPDTVVTLQMRPLGSGETGWTKATLVNFGSALRFDPAGLAAGTYEYRVTLEPPNEPSRVTATGTVAVLGSSLRSVSVTPSYVEANRSLRPTVGQKLDRWGNVVEITDPRAAYWKTTYRYDASNHLVQQTRPDAAGNTSFASPVTTIYYDRLGRQVAVRDANNFVNGQVFDAGGNLVKELHADAGVVINAYDAFGNKVATTDAENHLVTYRYDKMGRLLELTKPSAVVYQANAANEFVTVGVRNITESWRYDQLGRKLTQTNGNGEMLSYTYDLRGNVIETKQPIGEIVRAAYDAQDRKIAEVDATNHARTWTYDYFGQLKLHTDLGNQTTSYAYDKAGQLVWQGSTRGQGLTYAYDAAGQLVTIHDFALDEITIYAYDLTGRKIRERVVQKGVTYQDNHLSYDPQGYLRDVADARAHVMIGYDAVGNRTRVATLVGYQGNEGEKLDGSDRYFQYDAMNRQTTVDAVNPAGQLGQYQGHWITYDKNGNRKTDTYYGNVVVTSGGTLVITGYDENGVAIYAKLPVTYTQAKGFTTENYRYDDLNRLQSVTKDDMPIDVRFYDGADRVVQSGPGGAFSTEYAEALNAGLAPGQMNGNETRINRYDQDGRLLHQRVLKSDNTVKLDISWDPNEPYRDSLLMPPIASDGYDAAGNVRSYVTVNHESGAISEFTTTKMEFFEGYQALQIDGVSSQLNPGTTTQQYDPNGYLVAVNDWYQPNNNRWFVNDAKGKALFVNQAGHVQRQLIVNGEVLGLYGVGVDPTNPASGANNNPNFADIVDFDFGYAKINAGYPTPSPGAYTVRTGDTLQTIAQGAYGDSSLWYRIAEANGLMSNNDLRVGQTLNIPNRVATISNNNSTFKPYDPSRIEGDKTPSLATPQDDGDCGGVGKVLMVVVAIAVTIYTVGALTAQTLAVGEAMSAGLAVMAGSGAVVTSGLGAALGAAGTMAAGAAAGSMASQLVGLATGTIEKFDWKGVALSAVSAGVSTGLAGGMLRNISANVIVRAAVTSAITQGIGVVTGLQKGFNWLAVAASAAGAAAGEAANAALGGLPADGMGPGKPLFTEMGIAGDILRGTISGTVAGLAATAMRGGKVSVQQVAADAFGNALGQSIAQTANGVAPSVNTRFPDADNTYYAPHKQAAGQPEFVNAMNRLSVDRIDDYPSIQVVDAGDRLDVDRDRIDDLDRQIRNATNVLNMLNRKSRADANAAATARMIATGAADVRTLGEVPITPRPYTSFEAEYPLAPAQTAAPTAEVEQVNGRAAPEFQEANDQKVIAGTYDRFSEIGRAWSGSNWGDMWRHITFEASLQARDVAIQRVFPPQHPDAVRLQRMANSPIGTIASTAGRVFGADQQRQDALLMTGSLIEQLGGASSQVYKQTLTAPTPIAVMSGSPPRGTGIPSFDVPFRPLSPAQRQELRAKLDERTMTRDEYARYNWDARFRSRRVEGIREFWAQERSRLQNGMTSTRNWDEPQREAILNGQRPQFEGETIQGHHRYGALRYPQLANDPRYIYPSTPREHLYRWHGGITRNPTSGWPLNPLFPEEF